MNATLAEGGTIRTIHIGTRWDVKHCRLLRCAFEHGAVIIKLDFAIEVPVLPSGLEVYCRPSGKHTGAAIKKHQTFDGQNFMWVWNAGVCHKLHFNPLLLRYICLFPFAGDPEQGGQRAADCMEALCQHAADDESYSFTGSMAVHGVEGLSTSSIVRAWSARAPLRAEVDLVRYTHKAREVEYFNLHHHTAPHLPCLTQSRKPKLDHVIRRLQKARGIIEHLRARMPDMVANGEVRVRHEHSYINLTRSSLGLATDLAGSAFFDAVIQFMTYDCVAMHLYRHHVNAIQHSQFHPVSSALFFASMECDSLEHICQALLGQRIGSYRIGVHTPLERLGFVTEIALRAQTARVHQSLFSFSNEDREAIQAEVKWKSFFEAHLPHILKPAAKPSEATRASEPPSLELVVYAFVCSLTVEPMRYCLQLLGETSTGTRSELINRLNAALFKNGERTLHEFCSALGQNFCSASGQNHSSGFGSSFNDMFSDLRADLRATETHQTPVDFGSMFADIRLDVPLSS